MQSYNIHSWLTAIGGTLFREELDYETGAVPRWDGRISSTRWMNPSETAWRSFRYGYDSLSRLVSADYSGAETDMICSEEYDYDLNCNLLHRTSSAPGMFMPTLEERTYEGNRLEADLTNGVSYDACGRYTGSSGSVVSTSYNEIGLPLEMTLSDGSMVRTVYAADGRKLRETTVLSGTSATRSYSGSCIFEGNTLKKVLFEGGYAQMSGSTPSYMFFLTDHLGSVRVVAAQNGTVKQVNQYYPFGDLIADSHVTAGTSDNRYRFIGKELGERTGLYDFSARYLEPSMGRFTTIDPLAEKYPSVSPYAYCAGDPVNLVDLDGRREWPVAPEYNNLRRNHLNNYNEPRGTRLHKGIDINMGNAGNADYGAPVYATHPGIITRIVDINKTTDTNAVGSRISITYTAEDGTAISTSYMHLGSILDGLELGMEVEEGMQIGTIGRSGDGRIDRYTAHLHYELKIDGVNIDPTLGPDHLNDPMVYIEAHIHINSRMRMKSLFIKAFALVSLLLCTVSCEKEIKFVGDYDGDKIVLYSCAVEGHPLTADLFKSQFSFSGDRHADPRLPGATVSLEVDGKTYVFTEDTSDPEVTGHYVSDYVPQAGDRMVITAKCDGFKEVRSQTVVPVPAHAYVKSFYYKEGIPSAEGYAEDPELHFVVEFDDPSDSHDIYNLNLVRTFYGNHIVIQ